MWWGKVPRNLCGAAWPPSAQEPEPAASPPPRPPTVSNRSETLKNAFFDSVVGGNGGLGLWEPKAGDVVCAGPIMPTSHVSALG